MSEWFERSGVRWNVAPGQVVADVLTVAELAVRRARSGALQNLKGGRRKGLYFFDAPDGNHYVLKSNRYEGTDRLRRRAIGSKSRQELEMARRVAALGIPTPAPLAVGEEIRGGLLVGCWCLVPWLADAVDLRAGVRDGLFTPAQRRALARPFGAFAARLHDAGVDQDDFSPNNFMVRFGDPTGSRSMEFWAIDFERAKIRRGVPRARRTAQLAKLARELTRVSDAERMRFLHGYAGEAAREWWGAVETASAERFRLDLKRMRRTALGNGRRFRRIAGPGWRGHARDDLELAPRPEDLAGAPAGPAREGDFLFVPLGADAHPDHWVLANLLYLRELAPEPRAYWRGQAGGGLVYTFGDDFRLASPDPGPGERAAVRTLRGHLTALAPGRTEAGPWPHAVSRGPGGQLWAHCLDPRELGSPGGVRGG